MGGTVAGSFEAPAAGSEGERDGFSADGYRRLTVSFANLYDERVTGTSTNPTA
jgi:hypothetical protein